jgi:hypothetical protein
MCQRVIYKEKNTKKQIFLASLKLLNKGIGSGVGSVSQSTDPRIRIRTGMSRISNTGFFISTGTI